MSWYMDDGLWIKISNIATLNFKGVDYRCVLWNITGNDAINMLNNSKLDDKNSSWITILLQIKHLLKKLKIYSGVNGKWYRKSWKEFDELQKIDRNYYVSNCYDVNVNKHKVKCATSLRFSSTILWPINFLFI